MSRSAKIRSVVGRVAAEAEVDIEADYEQRGRSGEWSLRWCDGPTVDEVTAMVTKCARGYLTSEVVAGLRYRREKSARALVAALVQRLLDGERPEIYEARGIADATSFPADVERRAWQLAEFVLARVNVDPRSTGYYDAQPALDSLAQTDRDALLVDFWLFTDGGHSECSPEPPVLAVDTPAARAAVAELYRVLQDQLLGRSSHAGDPRARQLAAQAIRHAVPAMLADCQRDDAAAAVVDGWALRSLGRAVGLGDRTLSKSLGSLDEQVRTLTWLREHAEEWAAVCRAAGAAVHRSAPYLVADDVRRDIDTLRTAGGGHRVLLVTVSAARRLLEIRQARDRSTTEHLDALAELLADLDQAAPLTSRDRHSRKGVPPALTVSDGADRAAQVDGGSRSFE